MNINDIEKLIDDIFAEDVDINKSMDSEEKGEKKKKKVVNSASATPTNADDLKVDENIKVETDRSDFPNQINSFDATTGKISDKDYSAVQENNSASDIPEASQVKPKDNVVMKSNKIEISKEDFELLEKAKKAREEEEIKKAQEQQADLIKSVVSSVLQDSQSKIETLEKSVGQLTEIIGKLASRPQEPKSITSILEVMEKSQGETLPNQPPQSDNIYKAENRQLVLDTAMELHKSQPEIFHDNYVIEVENSFNNPNIPNGTIFENPQAKRMLDEALKRKVKN